MEGLADSVSGDSLLSGLELVSSCCVLTWQKGKQVLWGPFYKGTTPTLGGSGFMT